MSSPFVRRRGRALASLTAAALVAGTATFTAMSAPAASAPVEDCAAPFPVADLEEGQVVNGLTVSQGTEPDPFFGEVLGVLEDGIAPGLDMIIVDFTEGSEAIVDAGGIWSGMSGSPVYTEGGDLIGAVAYGLAYGPSPIAGVTPFEEMDDYLASGAPRPDAKVSVDSATARTIARGSEVSQRQAQQGFEQLGIATGVSGVGANRLAKLTSAKRAYFPKSAYAAGRVSPDVATADDVVAGGNLAATYSYGDIVFGGVGTATSVCQDQVVGFGHPMDFLGETSLSLHPASAIYIQPESLGAPFKVANFAAPVGTISEDHLAGITGAFGPTPEGATITSDVTYKSRQREGSSVVTVPDAWASVTFYQQLANHDRVIDAITKGSETQSWTITGSQGGTPFSLTRADRYTSRYDITYDASYELADLMYLLSGVEGVDVDDVAVASTVTDSTATYRLRGNEQLVKGVWKPVNNRNPATVKAGSVLRLRAVLRGTDGSSVRLPYSFKIPKRAAGSRAQVLLVGGNDYYSEEYFYDGFGGQVTLDDIKALIADTIRNDQVRATFYLGAAYPGEGEGECRGCRGKAVQLDRTLGPADKVVGGYKRLKVLVKPQAKG
jgi:hypothetical protein